MLGAVTWVACMAHAPPPTHREVSDNARKLAARHLRAWGDADLHRAEREAIRDGNPEWDFMGRTFLVLALGNMALREPHRQGEYLAVMDKVIDDTLATEHEEGMYTFLMDYATDHLKVYDQKMNAPWTTIVTPVG